jgi:hypothetical protein
MYRKVNNRYLLFLLVILAAAEEVDLLRDRKTGERSFRTELFTADSASISSISIYGKGKNTETLKLNKAGRQWEILSNNKSYPADTSSIKSLLHLLSHITAERVAGTDRSDWKKFEITDSASVRVIVKQGEKNVADFRVGKVSFTQSGGGQQYGGGRNVEVKSHIRVDGDERVYVVDGFLSMMLTDNPSQYRNHVLTRLDKNGITKLTFRYPGDSSFVLSKEGSKWLADGKPTDSAETEKFLSSIVNATGTEFADERNALPAFEYSLKIEGSNMATVDLEGAVERGSGKYFVRSNFNPASVFGSSSPNLFNQIFPGVERFSVKKPERSGKESHHSIRKK